MTRDEFDDFIEKYDLYSFDGLIQVSLKSGSIHRAVWITDIPPLEPSIDGTFKGEEDDPGVYYLFDEEQYKVWYPAEIERLECLQQHYLSIHARKKAN